MILKKNNFKKKMIILFLILLNLSCVSISTPVKRIPCEYNTNYIKIGEYNRKEPNVKIKIINSNEYNNYIIIGKLEITVPNNLKMEMNEINNKAKEICKELGGDGIYFYGIYYNRQVIIPFYDDICGLYKFDILKSKGN